MKLEFVKKEKYPFLYVIGFIFNLLTLMIFFNKYYIYFNTHNMYINRLMVYNFIKNHSNEDLLKLVDDNPFSPTLNINNFSIYLHYDKWFVFDNSTDRLVLCSYYTGNGKDTKRYLYVLDRLKQVINPGDTNDITTNNI